MADFVLKKNYFEFNGQIKQQISGNAIGTTFASSYVCLFIDKIDTAFLETQEYIDDILFIWTHSEQELQFSCVDLMSYILISNLHMSQEKKALHFLTLKLALKTVTLLQICM